MDGPAGGVEAGLLDVEATVLGAAVVGGGVGGAVGDGVAGAVGATVPGVAVVGTGPPAGIDETVVEVSSGKRCSARSARLHHVVASRHPGHEADEADQHEDADHDERATERGGRLVTDLLALRIRCVAGALLQLNLLRPARQRSYSSSIRRPRHHAGSRAATRRP